MKKLVGALLIAACAVPVSAEVLAEVENNDTLANAQVLDGHFTQGSVSITATAEIGGNDTFKFTALAGAHGTFDINNGCTNDSCIDSNLSIFNAAGDLLAANDDGGSLDSYIDYIFQNAGTYFVQVGSCCYNLPFQVYDGAGTYNLDINLTGGVENVPEPAMLGLFGLGAIGLGLSRRRKS